MGFLLQWTLETTLDTGHPTLDIRHQRLEVDTVHSGQWHCTVFFVCYTLDSGHWTLWEVFQNFDNF